MSRGGGSFPSVSAVEVVTAPHGDSSPTIWFLLNQKKSPMCYMSTVFSFLHPITADAHVSFADAAAGSILSK